MTGEDAAIQIHVELAELSGMRGASPVDWRKEAIEQTVLDSNLEILREMGFDADQARMALMHTNSVEAATDYILASTCPFNAELS
jgi:hypothetical protein